MKHINHFVKSLLLLGRDNLCIFCKIKTISITSLLGEDHFCKFVKDKDNFQNFAIRHGLVIL